MLSAWKKLALDGLGAIFTARRPGPPGKTKKTQLARRILRLEGELAWLACKLDPAPPRHKHIERDHPSLSIARQCELLGVPRSTFYYVSSELPASTPRSRPALEKRAP
jgi:putative transposase